MTAVSEFKEHQVIDRLLSTKNINLKRQWCCKELQLIHDCNLSHKCNTCIFSFINHDDFKIKLARIKMEN